MNKDPRAAFVDDVQKSVDEVIRALDCDVRIHLDRFSKKRGMTFRHLMKKWFWCSWRHRRCVHDSKQFGPGEYWHCKKCISCDDAARLQSDMVR
jgi:hypothetical protein